VISVGAYLQTVIQSAVDVPIRHHSLRPINWRHVLGGVISSLLICTAVQASPLPPVESASDLPTAPIAADAIANGVYFYGSAAEPDTLGAAYMVFAAQNSNLVGAMFMPQSSFDCFQGEIEGQQLAMQITNSYTQEVYGYAIALVANDAPIAVANDTPVTFELDGFHNLGAPRESEMANLATCQANFANVGTEL